MICRYYLSYGVSMVTETSGTRTGTLDSEYENIGIIPIYFVFHCPLGPPPRFSQPSTKNRINGTQRTEQSEVYGTKKEEKREKRRKLV